ncbi:DUF4350 domain-containing protein [Camelliibacillus cellulosilyticus]|uniref:DUF4350 domain-containing protein n=1 Tax=Camelliibacillus cellulosilyticus TaxID=2174486 RepID=A0ABV9GP49_9BACL
MIINKNRFFPWLVFILALLVFCSLALLLTPEKPRNYPPYLAASPSPTGIKAFYTYLKEDADFKTERWQSTADNPSNKVVNQVMFMIAPDSPFPKKENVEWERWMRKGNTLFLMADNPKDFFDIQTSVKHAASESVSSLTGENAMSGDYHGKITTPYRLVKSKDDRILLKDQQGILSLTRPYGSGQLVVFLEPAWLTNDQILKEDHLAPILKWLNQTQPKMIWFNDAIHGNSGKPSTFDVYPSWLIVLIAQCGLISLLLIWHLGKRFGPIELPRAATIRVNDERLRALAAWSRRGHLYLDALYDQEAYLRQRLEDRWQISAHTDDDALFLHLQRRLPKERYKEWQAVWKEWRQLKTQSKVSKKTLLQWSTTFQNLLKEVESL